MHKTLEALPAEIRYEVETHLKSLASFPESGDVLNFPFAGARSWTFVVPVPNGERGFSVLHIPDPKRQVVEVVGLGEINLHPGAGDRPLPSSPE
ncbi:MAG TPA: hypothetical protein VJB14_05645 [Planctomycetota bacterium]|nr:hypothetical protein [Planctomycetota bacterium]